MECPVCKMVLSSVCWVEQHSLEVDADGGFMLGGAEDYSSAAHCPGCGAELRVEDMGGGALLLLPEAAGPGSGGPGQESQLAKLRAVFEERYGSDWSRDGLTEDEVKAWVRAYYSDVDAGIIRKAERYLGVADTEYEGVPFEIAGGIDPDEEGCDLCALPLFRVRVAGYGEWLAYPEDLFLNP